MVIKGKIGVGLMAHYALALLKALFCKGFQK